MDCCWPKASSGDLRVDSRLAEGGTTMKWGGYNEKGEERMRRLLGTKAVYYLLTIATLGLLLAESIKWRPEGR